MSAVKCVRCGNEAPPPDFIPYAGALKEAVAKQVCAECWEAWKNRSVMVVNEFRLMPFLPQHKEILEQHMVEFLKLKL